LIAKKYILNWIDATATSFSTGEGIFDPKTNTMTFVLSGRDDSTGNMATWRQVDVWMEHIRRIALSFNLATMDDILRFSGTAKRDSDIDAWFRERPAELGSIAQKWFARMRQCGADVRELMHDGCPVACVADVPFAYVNVFRSHVNVGFFNRAALADPAGLLEGTGKNMRHVKLKPGSEVDAAALDDLIEAAYRDGRARAAE
jgi:hypothetical protein